MKTAIRQFGNAPSGIYLLRSASMTTKDGANGTTIYPKSLNLINQKCHKTKKFYPWLVVALLWVVALLNYMDHQMLSTMQEG